MDVAIGYGFWFATAGQPTGASSMLQHPTCVPWQYHSELSDSFVCREGPMVVETRAPRHTYRLLAGERCAVPPKTAHYVHGEADGVPDRAGCRRHRRAQGTRTMTLIATW